MANDVYAQIDGIKGESIDDKPRCSINGSVSVRASEGWLYFRCGACAMRTLLVLSSCLLFSATHANEIKCPVYCPSKETIFQEKKDSDSDVRIDRLHATIALRM
ncbi:hypothetical protein [Massilia sp. CT11-137]|uniref:hypothetical protein n=1 Tax=Massilia sp. CT11-137 TaxID=3393901 RepID=UPI0039A55EFD